MSFFCRLGEHELMLPPKQLLGGSKPAPVTAVSMSHCGNFAFVGTSTGRIDRYNMQSGIHRSQYCRMEVSANGARASLPLKPLPTPPLAQFPHPWCLLAPLHCTLASTH